MSRCSLEELKAYEPSTLEGLWTRRGGEIWRRGSGGGGVCACVNSLYVGYTIQYVHYGTVRQLKEDRPDQYSRLISAHGQLI